MGDHCGGVCAADDHLFSREIGRCCSVDSLVSATLGNESLTRYFIFSRAEEVANKGRAEMGSPKERLFGADLIYQNF
jgi:hypothetical protein